MLSDPRELYLKELGLTLWRRSGGTPKTDVRQQSYLPQATKAEAPVPAPEPERVPPPMVAEAPAPTPVPNIADGSVADMDWEQLEAELARRDLRGASRPVFGVGARDAPLLIVGEAPGAEEDKQGEPFVGRAGKLLDRMLFAIDHDRRRNTYIANICKFRPPDNRDPKPEEVDADRPFLERQIELIEPKLIVAVGRVAAQTLLASTENIGKMRGQEYSYPGKSIPVMVTYHPAYLLRSPQQKAKAWQDLQTIARKLQTTT